MNNNYKQNNISDGKQEKQLVRRADNYLQKHTLNSILHIKPTINNVTSDFQIFSSKSREKLDLHKIALIIGTDSRCLDREKSHKYYRNNNLSLEYKNNNKHFKYLKLELRKPESKCHVYKTGRLKVYNKNTSTAKLTGRKYARIIQQVGYPTVKVINFKISNISADIRIKIPVHFNNLTDYILNNKDENYLYIIHEPEIFPDLTFTMKKPNVDFCVFHDEETKGIKIKLSCTTNDEDINQAYSKFYYEKILKFIRSPENTLYKCRCR